MKKFLLTLVTSAIVLTTFSQAQGQDKEEIDLWPASLIEGTTRSKLTEHNIAKPTDSKTGGATVTKLTDISNPTIRVYRPKKANGTAVVVCPGGGYSILAMDLEGSEICTWLNSFGVTAVLLKYRVPAQPGTSKFELPLKDAQRAMGLVRYNAAKWKLKSDHIGILGFSAGGHLSAALSNNYKTRTYTAVDQADSASCRPDFAILIYPAYLYTPKEPVKLAPEVQVSQTTPPTFIVQTEDDPLGVQNSLTYYMQLSQFKIPAEMHLFETGRHGYGIRALPKGLDEYPTLIQKWLTNKVLPGEKIADPLKP